MSRVRAVPIYEDVDDTTDDDDDDDRAPPCSCHQCKSSNAAAVSIAWMMAFAGAALLGVSVVSERWQSRAVASGSLDPTAPW